MKLEYKRLLLAVMGIFLAGATRAPVVDVDEVSRAVGVCANATSKLGVDDQPFKTGAWTMETVDGLPGDRFYSKGDLRASLGTRPGVGGSCIISINVRSSYDLTPLTRALERAFNVKALVSSPTFALLPLPEKILQGRVAPTPVGSVVSVAVEMGP